MIRPAQVLATALLPLLALPLLATPVLGAEAARAGSGVLPVQFDPNQPAPQPYGAPPPSAGFGGGPGMPDDGLARPDRPRLTPQNVTPQTLTPEERQRRRELRAQRLAERQARIAAREARLARMTPEQRAAFEARRAERLARLTPEERAARAARLAESRAGRPDLDRRPQDPGRRGAPGDADPGTANPGAPRHGGFGDTPPAPAGGFDPRTATPEERRAALEARLARMTPEQRAAFEARRAERRAARQAAGTTAPTE